MTKAKKPIKTREANPGELREIHILETLERMSHRPETRIDIQKMLSSLSNSGQIYAKHLVMSGPSDLASAAKACQLIEEQIELAIQELEKGISRIRSS